MVQVVSSGLILEMLEHSVLLHGQVVIRCQLTADIFANPMSTWECLYELRYPARFVQKKSAWRMTDCGAPKLNLFHPYRKHHHDPPLRLCGGYDVATVAQDGKTLGCALMTRTVMVLGVGKSSEVFPVENPRRHFLRW